MSYRGTHERLELDCSIYALIRLCGTELPCRSYVKEVKNYHVTPGPGWAGHIGGLGAHTILPSLPARQSLAVCLTAGARNPCARARNRCTSATAFYSARTAS